MASVKRISEMTTIMAQRDRQADARLKLMSEAMHRRDIDFDKCMVNFITTVQDIPPGVKAVVATVPRRPSPVPVALNAANLLPTSAISTQQPTYREVVHRQSGTKPDQRNLNQETLE